MQIDQLVSDLPKWVKPVALLSVGVLMLLARYYLIPGAKMPFDHTREMLRGSPNSARARQRPGANTLRSRRVASRSRALQKDQKPDNKMESSRS